MNLTQLKIYILSRPVLDLEEIKRFFADKEINPQMYALEPEDSKTSNVVSAKHGQTKHSNAELLCEIGARSCYDSFGKGRSTTDHIKHIVDIGHGSVLEHANYTFMITGVSRALTHELVRHRAGFAFSQRSQRYVDESEANIVPPPALLNLLTASATTDKVKKLNKIWSEDIKQAYDKCMDAYNKLLPVLADLAEEKGLVTPTDKRKWARQQARCILPNMVETQITVTANLRAIRHFIYLRANAAADNEIRGLAVELYKIMVKECPNVFYDMQLRTLESGDEVVDVMHPKV